MVFSVFSSGGGSGGSQSTCIYVVDIYLNSPDIPLLAELISNANAYKGHVVYTKRMENIPGRDPWPDPFVFPHKFYFNEDGEWFESPFSINGALLL